MKKFLGLALSTSLMAMASAANATYVAPTTPTGDFVADMNCDTTGVTSYDFCTGMVTDTGGTPATNDSEAAMNDNSFFGFNDWVQIDKDDNPGTVFTGSDLSLTYTDSTSGDYVISGSNTDYALVIKASAGFSAYLLTSLTGTFDNAGLVNKGGNTPAISHISLYGRGTGGGGGGGNPPVIPLPLPVVLLSTAIGITGLYGRRRSKA